MSLRVELSPDRDPRVYVVPGDEEVTNRVRNITLFPHRMASATLLSHRDGGPFLLPGTDEVATETHPVLQITGEWVANVFRLGDTP